MRSPFRLAVVVASFALGATAWAQDKAPGEKLEAISLHALLRDTIREDDVTLLFNHLRESMSAATRGEEAQESEALRRRAKQLQRDLSERGSTLMGALLSALEAEAKRALRDALRDSRQPAPRLGPGT
jgi:hypothetical protein